MYDRSCINVIFTIVERRSTFVFTRDTSYITTNVFYARKIYVRTYVKITRQWKSTRRNVNGRLNFFKKIESATSRHRGLSLHFIEEFP